MNYLLDTDICVYWLKGDVNIEKKAVKVGLLSLNISFITLSELFYGAYKSKKTLQNLENVRLLEERLGVMESNQAICDMFGKLKADLEKAGRIIDDADLFIAACALVNDFILVTNNEKHFKRIKGLKIENWHKS